MLAGELALAGVDVQVVERRTTSELVGMRARGFHSRTIEILDQRGIADRFLAAGQTFASASFANTPVDISDLPTRHPYTLALVQREIERILTEWVEELGVPIHRGREVVGFAQDAERCRRTAGGTAPPCVRRTWWRPTADAARSARQPGSSSPAGRRRGAP